MIPRGEGKNAKPTQTKPNTCLCKKTNGKTDRRLLYRENKRKSIGYAGHWLFQYQTTDWKSHPLFQKKRLKLQTGVNNDND